MAFHLDFYSLLRCRCLCLFGESHLVLGSPPSPVATYHCLFWDAHAHLIKEIISSLKEITFENIEIMADNYIHGMDWTFQHEGGLGALKNYRDYQYNLVGKHIGKRILEVGSGDRGFTAEIAKHHPDLEKFVSIEPSEGLYNQHLNTYKFSPKMQFFNEDLFNLKPDSYGLFDTVVFIHVLEHIEQDRMALDHASSLLEPGGKVLIEVPALPFLFSVHDELLGHYRRYTKSTLKKAIDTDKYKIERLWYSDPIGVAGSFVFFKLLKRKLNTGEGANLVKQQGSVYDKYIIPFEKKIEKYMTFPFGLSLNAVLVKN